MVTDLNFVSFELLLLLLSSSSSFLPAFVFRYSVQKELPFKNCPNDFKVSGVGIHYIRYTPIALCNVHVE